MSYERLTERQGGIVRYLGGDNDTLATAYEKLKYRLCELEEKIKSGTLVELPCNCKIGDLVYGVADYFIKPKLGILTYVEITKYCIQYGIVDKRLMRHDVKYVYCPAEKEAAEAKLNELKGE